MAELQKTIVLSLLKFWGFRFGGEKTRELGQILKLRKSHASPECFLFCPFQQGLQIYFKFVSMIYIIRIKFTTTKNATFFI